MSRGLTPEEQRQIIRDVLGQGSDISPANPLQTEDAKIQIMEIEKSFAGNEHFANISVTTADQSLGSETINVGLPTGASITAAIAVAVIHIMNNAATLQKIDLDLLVDTSSVFSQNDVVGLPAVDGDSTSFTIFQDVSGIITATGNHTLEAQTTLSDAHSTHFTTQYLIIIAYKMS